MHLPKVLHGVLCNANSKRHQSLSREEIRGQPSQLKNQHTKRRPDMSAGQVQSGRFDRSRCEGSLGQSMFVEGSHLAHAVIQSRSSSSSLILPRNVGISWLGLIPSGGIFARSSDSVTQSTGLEGDGAPAGRGLIFEGGVMTVGREGICICVPLSDGSFVCRVSKSGVCRPASGERGDGSFRGSAARYVLRTFAGRSSCSRIELDCGFCD